MCGRILVREIRGRVFLDANKDGVMNGSEQPLKDIGIRLFVAESDEAADEREAEVRIRRERLLARVKTDEAGEFRFLVRDGAYSVCLDAESLPSGLETADGDRILEPGRDGHVDFAIRDAEKPAPRDHPDARPSCRMTVGCPADRIREARRNGEIDERAEIGYLLDALFDTGRLPHGYRSGTPIKSGTLIAEQIKEYIGRPNADPELAETAKQRLAASVPKLDREYRSPGGYFNIHYTLSGEHAAAGEGDPKTVPGYIVQTARAFDDVKKFTCGSRGFREPLLQDGRDAFDVYVFDQKGKYGVTYSTGSSGKMRAGSRKATCFICIDNTYSPKKGFDKSREGCMKVTAAHEFFHAVQYAYNVDSDSWWKEASATWNEDEVYDDVNDYLRYIPGFLSSPSKPLDESSYGGVVFAKFLSENYGGSNMIKRIWEVQSSGLANSIAAIDRAVREKYPERDLEAVFNQFSAYNVNPAQYYKEGALWKASAAMQKTYSGWPSAEDRGRLDHMSSNYILVKPGEKIADKSLRIAVEGTGGARLGFKLQNKKRRDGQYSMTEIVSTNTDGRTVITVNNFAQAYESICLIPSNLEKDRDGLRYSYTVKAL